MQVALKLTDTAFDHRLEPRPDPAAVPTLADLTLLQREVVAIGRADAAEGALVLGGGRLAERLRSAAALIAGRRRAKPLADPRLEALRRFAQRAALGCEQIADIRALQGAGFEAAQIVMAARLARQPVGDR